MFLNSLLSFLNFFRTSYISRIFSGKCKLSQSKWIGTIRRCLTGRDQFICCSNRIMDLRNNLHDQILRKCSHLRPVLNIRTKLDLYTRISSTLAVKYTIVINCLIKEIFLSCITTRIILC